MSCPAVQWTAQRPVCNRWMSIVSIVRLGVLWVLWQPVLPVLTIDYEHEGKTADGTEFSELLSLKDISRWCDNSETILRRKLCLLTHGGKTGVCCHCRRFQRARQRALLCSKVILENVRMRWSPSVSLSSHFSSSHYVDAVSSVLIPHGVIQERVKKMARNILEDVLQVNPGGE